MSLSRVVIGTIDEMLARARAETARQTIQVEFPHAEISVSVVPRPARRGGGTGAGRTVEKSLLAGKVDVMVYPTRELPALLPEGLALGAILRRATPFDVLLSVGAETLDELPHGSRVLARSLRRRGQLASYRPDLDLAEARGKLSRWRRELDSGACRGVVVAADTVEHLGLQELVGEILSPGVCLPAPGQGGMALVARHDDRETMRALRVVSNPGTWSEITSEVTLLRTLGTDSVAAIGALAHVSGPRLSLEGVVVGSEDGDMARCQVEGEAEEPEELGGELAERLLALGAGDLLRSRGRTRAARPAGRSADMSGAERGD